MKAWIRLWLVKVTDPIYRAISSWQTNRKIKQFKRLEAKYGHWKNIPEGEMPQFFNPIPQGRHGDILLTLTFMEVAKLIGKEVHELDGGQILIRMIRSEYDHPDQIALLEELDTAKNLNQRVLDHFIECGDITLRQVEWKLNTPELKANFQKWIEGKTRYIFPQESKEEADVDRD